MLNALVCLALLQEAPVPPAPEPPPVPSGADLLREQERTTPFVLEGAPAPGLPAPRSTPVDFFWTIFWSVFVLGLLVGALWLLKRTVRGSRFAAGGGVAVVLARVALDAHTRVWVLDVGRTIYLVGGGREGLAALGSIRDPEEVAQIRARAGGREFDASLREQIREGERGEGVQEVREQLGRIKQTVKRWGGAPG